MAKIYVHTAFNLQHKGERHFFPIGNHAVPAEIADHWYTQAHIGKEPPSDPDTSAAADAMLADLEAKEKALAARAADMNATGDVLDKRHKDVDRREEDVSRRESSAAQLEAALDARQADLDAREKTIVEREKAADNATSEAKAKDVDKAAAAKPNASK